MTHLSILASVLGAILFALGIVYRNPPLSTVFKIVGGLVFTIGVLLPTFVPIQTVENVQALKFAMDIFDAPNGSCLKGADGRAYLLRAAHAQDQDRVWISPHPNGLLEPFGRRHPGHSEAWWRSQIIEIIKPDDPRWQDCLRVYSNQRY